MICITSFRYSERTRSVGWDIFIILAGLFFFFFLAMKSVWNLVSNFFEFGLLVRKSLLRIFSHSSKSYGSDRQSFLILHLQGFLLPSSSYKLATFWKFWLHHFKNQSLFMDLQSGLPPFSGLRLYVLIPKLNGPLEPRLKVTKDHQITSGKC